MAKDCNKAVDAAIADSVPGEIAIEVSSNKIKISEIKARVCAPLEKLATEVRVKAKAEEAAKFAPYTKVLGGDKLKVFNNTYRGGTNVYGPGGKLLRALGDFVKASVWFTYGVNRDGVQPRWSTDRYAFKGMKQRGHVTHQNGWADTPPSSAYR
jgi:hypothetical protein